MNGIGKVTLGCGLLIGACLLVNTQNVTHAKVATINPGNGGYQVEYRSQHYSLDLYLPPAGHWHGRHHPPYRFGYPLHLRYYRFGYPYDVGYGGAYNGWRDGYNAWRLYW